jgi:hypothetical protein
MIFLVCFVDTAGFLPVVVVFFVVFLVVVLVDDLLMACTPKSISEWTYLIVYFAYSSYFYS